MDEKTLLPLLPPAAQQSRRSPITRGRVVAGCLSAALVAGLLLLHPLPSRPASLSPDIVAPQGIRRSPNSTVLWTPCADAADLLCSTLVVPLNWLDPVEGESAEIALKMQPADKGKRKGSLLINPGGPGGSGTALAHRGGKSLSTIVEGAYDIIGFDPRGVNMTAPFMQAFDDNWQAQLFNVENMIEFSHDPSKQVNMTDPVTAKEQLRLLRHHDAVYEALNEGVRERVSERQRKAVSTAFVVRDMVALVDALGDGDELVYFGFSYGTILGATFAAMFPSRVGRMVLDGVSHSGDYTSGLEAWGWSSMTDSDAVLAEFCRICALAGPKGCDLAPKHVGHLSSSDAAAAVANDINGLIERLWERPLRVQDSKFGPGLLTASEVHLLVFKALYSPLSWAATASALSTALQGNGTLARNLIGLPDDVFARDPQRKALDDNVYHHKVDRGSGLPTPAILCSDQEPESDSLDAILQRSAELRTRSFTAPEWTQLMLPCRTWTDRPFERYAGPWTQADGLRTTKSKLLWIGNTFDPVTPLASAQRMADGFGPDSGSLLIHDGRGHCTLAEPSICTTKAIRAYLVDGVVPEWGTVCQAEPGQIFPTKDDARAVLAVEDAALLDAVRALHRAIV